MTDDLSLVQRLRAHPIDEGMHYKTSREAADALERLLAEREWRPIASAPIEPFVADTWWHAASPTLLLLSKDHPILGWYAYDPKGMGGWRATCGVIHPTHWLPTIPDPPKESK